MTPPRMRMETHPPATSIALMVTRRCNMRCGHCSVESGPDVRGEPTEGELLDRVGQAAAGGVRAINLTGGEPMLVPGPFSGSCGRRAARRRHVLDDERILGTHGGPGVARRPDPSEGWPWLARRQRRSLPRRVPGPDPGGPHRARRREGGSAGANQSRRAGGAGRGRPARLAGRAVRGTSRHAASILRAPGGRPGARPADRDDGRRGGWLLRACAVPAVTDDGRLTACNGPAYFAPGSSPLIVGSLRTETLGTLLERHRQDPILDTIRTSGPAGLRDELQTLPGFERFPFRARYLGICDLCLHITSDANAVAALRRRLAVPGGRRRGGPRGS